MTIRLQIFLFVALLFTALGAVSGAVAWRLETSAIHRSLVTEAQATAVTLAELADPADVQAMKSGTPLTQTRLGTVWVRLQRWSVVRRFYLLEPGSGLLLDDTAPGSPLPTPAEIKDLGPDEVRPLAPRVTNTGQNRLPLAALTAHGAGVLVAEISLDDYLRQRTEILSQVKIDALLAALVGLAVAWILSRMISQPIQRLGLVVEKIGAPSFSAEEAESVIREVADLGNTFGVMHSVLGKTGERARRALVESDFYRTDAGLAAVYRRELLPPRAWAGGGAEAAWLTVGSPPPAALAGAAILGPASGAAFAGIAGSGSEIEAAVRARAAAAFLADALVRKSLGLAAAEAEALFGLSELVVVRWNGAALECWRSGGSIGAPPDPAAWDARAPVALACLGAVNRQRLDLYLANFPQHAAERLLPELPPLLSAAEPGVVLVLRRG
jgi:hypothetical protein